MTKQETIIYFLKKGMRARDIDYVLNVSSRLDDYKETIQKETDEFLKEYKAILPQYIATILFAFFFSYDDEIKRCRYTLKSVPIDTTLSKDEMKWCEAHLTDEEYQLYFYENHLELNGVIPPDISFRDVLQEYIGRVYSSSEKDRNPFAYVGTELDENVNRYYRIGDRLQCMYMEDLKGIVRNILSSHSVGIFNKEETVGRGVLDAIAGVSLEWFRDNTGLGDVFFVKNVVEMGGWGDKTLADLMAECKVQPVFIGALMNEIYDV